jgi:hypothetical protein
MGWIAAGIVIAGLFIGLGLEAVAKSLVFASGRWGEYEAQKTEKGE